MHCRINPSYFKCKGGTGRFLYYDDVYVRYTVEFDGQFGPYSACNPVAHDDWTCADPCGSSGGMCPGLYISSKGGGTGPPDPAVCGAASCTRAKQAVGWIPKGVTHSPCIPGAPCDKKPLPPAPWPANGYELQSLLQGHWFSTRAESECVGAARPGDGSACTWRLLPTGQVAKNVSCVHRKVMESVMAKNQTCFSSCADGNNPLPSNPSNCWTECTFQTIIGTWTGLSGTPGMSAAELVATFDNAMAPVAKGGCPAITMPTRLGRYEPTPSIRDES